MSKLLSTGSANQQLSEEFENAFEASLKWTLVPSTLHFFFIAGESKLLATPLNDDSAIERPAKVAKIDRTDYVMSKGRRCP